VAKNLGTALGSRLAELRKRQGLSQEALAERAGLHRNYVGLLEHGKRRASLEALASLTRELDVTLAEFFEPFRSHFRRERPRQRPRTRRPGSRRSDE
jgi:transcriptional regulator with XRE-family HTH domain